MGDPLVLGVLNNRRVNYEAEKVDNLKWTLFKEGGSQFKDDIMRLSLT